MKYSIAGAQPVADVRSVAPIWTLAALILAAFPFVYQHFPTYAPGYLIQIPAEAGFYYFRHFRLFSTYTDWRERGLLILSFVIPLQNTFWLKAFRKALLSSHLLLEVMRPEILPMLIIVASAIIRPRFPHRQFPSRCGFCSFPRFFSPTIKPSIASRC